MKKILFILAFIAFIFTTTAQVMTPEKLWSVDRVSAVGLTGDRQKVIYSVRSYDIDENTSTSRTFIIPVTGGDPVAVNNIDSIYKDRWQDFTIGEVENNTKRGGSRAGNRGRLLPGPEKV